MTTADPKLLEEVLAHLSDEPKLSESAQAKLEGALELLKKSNYPCLGWLWDHYVVGLTYEELGKQEGITEAAACKRVRRCLKLAEELVNQ